MATEKRMISYGDAVRFLRDSKVPEKGAFSKGINKGLNIAISALGNNEILPYVDAVEVVRCKDCKWRNTRGCPYMNFNAAVRDDSDYCSDGERKDNE
jgi:hypothetical protein